MFWDRVYFKRDETSASRGGGFPSQSNEDAGRFVGFSEDVGHTMTYKVLTDDTNKIIYRSRIKLSSLMPNARIDTPTALPQVTDNPTPPPPPMPGESDKSRPMAYIDTNDLIGRTYLSTPQEDGTRRRLEILQQLDKIDNDSNKSPEMIRFRASTDDGTIEEIITYNQILDKIESEDGENDEWHFKYRIVFFL